MSSFELNKIAAAVLIAGIIALVAGILANNIIQPHPLDKLAIEIAGAEDTGNTGGDAPQEKKGPESIMALLAAADLKSGETVFKKCATCHTPEKDGAHRQGPNLWNVVGAKVAHHQNYSYSKAMAAHGGEWNYETLNAYLFKPAEYVKGTKMTFVGIPKTKERADLIAYLRTMSDSPLPLPAADVVAAPAAEAPAAAAPAPAPAVVTQ